MKALVISAHGLRVRCHTPELGATPAMGDEA